MKRPEEALQCLCADWLPRAYPGLIWFAVPNQKGTRSTFEMGILKRIGVKAGVSDLIICLPNGRFGAIELKAPKGKVTDEQSKFLAAVELAGGYSNVCRSFEDFTAILARWLAPLGWASKVRL